MQFSLFRRPLLALSLFCSLAAANSEKVVFVAPAPQSLHAADPAFTSLTLQTLDLSSPVLRVDLARAPPGANNEDTPSAPTTQSWFLLKNLSSGQRYELRINSAAIQPSRFHLDTFPLSEVLDTPALRDALTEYVNSHDGQRGTGSRVGQSIVGDGKASSLLVRVKARADFYTADEALMESPGDVLADIILDPYVWNAVPESLLLTITYIAVLAVASWFLSQAVWTWLLRVGKGTKAHVG